MLLSMLKHSQTTKIYENWWNTCLQPYIIIYSSIHYSVRLFCRNTKPGPRYHCLSMLCVREHFNNNTHKHLRHLCHFAIHADTKNSDSPVLFYVFLCCYLAICINRYIYMHKLVATITYGLNLSQLICESIAPFTFKN